MFQREFTLTARLNHPGVLRVYEPVRAADATVLPMVLAAGGDLRQMRGAPYTKILPLLIDIAAALEHAHARRIVHRDLKPSNILLDGAGRPLLADFGAGASEGDNSSGPPGSPFSASPQQLAGEPARPADDIYGLGALAYELLSGYPPFYPAFDAKKIATEPVPRLKPVKPIPPRLELLVSWLLAKQGRERPPSMRHVADEMNAVLQDTLGLEGNAAETAAETEAAILAAAADNLTPAVMADEDETAVASPVRELEEIDPGMLPQVDELRAQVMREQRARNRRRGWVIAAVPRRRRGRGRRCCCRSSPASRRWTSPTLQLPAGPTEAEIRPRRRSAEELATQHTELSKRIWSSTRAPPRSGAARNSPPPASRSTKSAACSSAASMKRAPAPLAAARQGARPKSKRACRRRWPRRSPKANARSSAGEFENARQAFDTALKIEPGNQRSHRVARQGGRGERRGADAGRCRERRERPRTCPRRRPCSPTCSSEIPATWRPPRASRA